METLSLWVQGLAAGTGGALGMLTGGTDALCAVLLSLIAADYITGVLCAIVDKRLNSRIGFRGIAKKILILMLVGVAHALDHALIKSGAPIRTAVIFFYCTNESISLLENADRLGLPIPAKLRTALAQFGHHQEREARAMTEKNGAGLAAYAAAMVGESYWYGTCGYLCTESLLKSKRRQYPTHYAASRLPSYQEDIRQGRRCADCAGLIKGYYWTKDDGTQQYLLDGRPDKGANGMKRAAKESGPIAALPEIPGLILWKPDHVGVYLGGDEVAEARRFGEPISKNRVSARDFQLWFKCPYIGYPGAALPHTPSAPHRPTLKIVKGKPLMTGEAVLEAQRLLEQAGFSPGTPDGIYGAKTAAAASAYQKSRRLEADGIIGPQTWRELLK